MIQVSDSEFYDHLMRGLTHRMNNILSVFHSYLGLLIDESYSDPEVREGLFQVKSKASAATELMERIHALARPSSIVWREVNLSNFFASIEPALCSELGKGVGLEIKIPDEIPPLWTDPTRLRIVLVELFRNALEATQPGKTIFIEAHLEQPDAKVQRVRWLQWICMSITDAGPGVAPEIAHRIFEPFFSTRHERDAQGLGLSVVLSLTQQLGGVIRLDSHPGRTVFRLLLPSRAEEF
jgi:signal transduction histidine kinase